MSKIIAENVEETMKLYIYNQNAPIYFPRCNDKQTLLRDRVWETAWHFVKTLFTNILLMYVGLTLAKNATSIQKNVHTRSVNTADYDVSRTEGGAAKDCKAYLKLGNRNWREATKVAAATYGP